MDDLASVLTSEKGGVDGLRYGIVTSLSPLRVRVGAASTAAECRCLASYRPTIGDFVAVVVSGPDRLILGATSATGNTTGVSQSVAWTNGPAPVVHIGANVATFDTRQIMGISGHLGYNRYTVNAEGTVLWQVMGAFLSAPVPSSAFTYVQVTGLPVPAVSHADNGRAIPDGNPSDGTLNGGEVLTFVGRFLGFNQGGAGCHFNLTGTLTGDTITFWGLDGSGTGKFPGDPVADPNQPIIGIGDLLSWTIQYQAGPGPVPL